MGRQQLILVILVAIIIVVAIKIYSSATDSANVDAVNKDLASIAVVSQDYYMKPAMLSGGANSFDEITWKKIGAVPCKTEIIEADGSAENFANCVNDNGTYVINTAEVNELRVIGYASSGKGYVRGTGVGSVSYEVTITPDAFDIQPIENNDD